MEKNAPKNNRFYQELIALYGTFAIPEKQGLIIDKTKAQNDEQGVPTSHEDLLQTLNPSLLMFAKKIQKEH